MSTETNLQRVETGFERAYHSNAFVRLSRRHDHWCFRLKITEDEDPFEQGSNYIILGTKNIEEELAKLQGQLEESDEFKQRTVEFSKRLADVRFFLSFRTVSFDRHQTTLMAGLNMLGYRTRWSNQVNRP